MEGPRGRNQYLGYGKFLIKKKPFTKTKVGLIAGGTGIAPLFQILQASTLANDGLQMVLIYSNKTKEDILMKAEIDEMAAKNTKNLQVHYTLTRHDDSKHGDCSHLKGRVCQEMFKKCQLPPPSPETLIFFCGNKGFNKCCAQQLEEMGYSEDMYVKL